MNGMKELRSFAENKDEFIELIKTSTSKLDMLRKLSINIKNKPAKDFIDSFVKENKININHFKMGVEVHHRFSYDEIKKAVDNNICWSDLAKSLGYSAYGGNLRTVKKLVKHYKISTDHFDYKKAVARGSKNRGQRPQKVIETMFVENSSTSRLTIKNYVIKHHLIEEKCFGDGCSITNVWNGKPIVLTLEHKNGINNDHRLENLCFLCPNCHSQTDTFAGRNKRLK